MQQRFQQWFIGHPVFHCRRQCLLALWRRDWRQVDQGTLGIGDRSSLLESRHNGIEARYRSAQTLDGLFQNNTRSDPIFQLQEFFSQTLRKHLLLGYESVELPGIALQSNRE